MITPAVWKSEFTANTTTVGTQYFGDVTAAADGSFYTVWANAATGSSYLTGRKFDSNGNPLTGETVFDSSSGAGVNDGVVTADGHIHTAYSLNGDTSVADRDSTLAQSGYLYPENGSSTSTNPTITAFPGGGQFVAYTLENSSTDWALVGNTISPSGVLGAATNLVDTSYRSDHARLVTLDDGDYEMVFQSEDQGSSSNHDIFSQIGRESGAPFGGYDQVQGARSGDDDRNPDVAALHSGGFVVVWTTGASGSEDIHATVYADGSGAAGLAVHSSITVNTTTAGEQDYAHVASMDDGGFLVTWEDLTAADEKAQRFDYTGNKIGQEIVVHSGIVDDMSVATLADGRTVMSFSDSNGTDYDIQDAIFDTRTNVTGHVSGHDLFGDGSADQLIVTVQANGDGGAQRLFDLNPTGGLYEIGEIGSNCSIVGSGDLNSDGLDDLVVQYDANGHRDIYALFMGMTHGGSNQVTAVNKLGTVGLDWQVDGTGDFNGDGYKDILLERVNNGAKELNVLGVQNGAATSVNATGVLAASYQVDGIGDMNHDGRSDILVHNDDPGGRHFFELDQANYSTQAVKTVATIGPEWNAMGMGDFNGDGYADILITHDTATARDIGMLVNPGASGGAWTFKDLGPIVGKNVQIDGIGDFNGDGTADISAHYEPDAAHRVDLYFEVHNDAIVAIHNTGSTGHDWIIA